MTTEKLYDKDAYACDFSAKVLECEQQGDKYCIILDRTLFFPEEGGQSCDKGELDGKKVLDVQIKDDVIYHFLSEALEVGKEVKGKIDFSHRFYNMQQHSGEHIFSGLVNSMFGFANVGFHLSDNSVTMDYNGVLSKEDILLVEKKVNMAITQNIEIKAFYPSDEELKATEYRLKKELKGPIRLVIIPGYDACACCAPHVKRTGEIGMLKVISVKNYKGGVRLNILCGFRALQYYNESLDLLDGITDIMTTGRENLLANINGMKEENKYLSSALAETKQKLLLTECESIPEEEENVLLVKGDTDNFIMRQVLNELMKRHKGICAFFAGSDGHYKYLLSSTEKDVRDMQKALNGKYQAKGGGKAEMVQGSLSAQGLTEKELRDFFDEYVNAL